MVKSIKAMHEGKAKVFFAMGGNFLSATPDTNYTAQALRKCDLSVHVSTKLNPTIYGLDDRYRGVYNERRVVFMNEKDISKRGLNAGDIVDIFNTSDGKERVARKFILIAYDIPEKCIATYFPEANVLVPIKSVADGSNQPASKPVVVKVRKHV